MPVPLAWILKVIKGAGDNIALRRRGKKLNEELALPVTGRTQGIERFYLLGKLEELAMREQIAVESRPEHIRALNKQFIAKMRRLISMNQEELRKKPATHEDLELMLISVREFAVTLDENMDALQHKVERKLQAWDKEIKMAQKRNIDEFNRLRKRLWISISFTLLTILILTVVLQTSLR